MMIPLITPWGPNYSNYFFNYSKFLIVPSPILNNDAYSLGNCLVYLSRSKSSRIRTYGFPARKSKTILNSWLFPWFCVWSGCCQAVPRCGYSIKQIIPLIIPNYSLEYSFRFQALIIPFNFKYSSDVRIEAGYRQGPLLCCRCWGRPGPQCRPLALLRSRSVVHHLYCYSAAEASWKHPAATAPLLWWPLWRICCA